MDIHPARALFRQIGTANIMAISGGRVTFTPDGMTLPVAHGYRVVIVYDRGRDTYTVSRVFVRNGQATVKGTREDVYAEEVGAVAYRASCYHDPF